LETGYVALPYVTDWAYACSESICETNLNAESSNILYVRTITGCIKTRVIGLCR